jgi:hypothetical protein
MLVASYCHVLLLLLFDLLFVFCSTFFPGFCSIQFYCSVFIFTGKYSVLILDCIPDISIPLNIISPAHLLWTTAAVGHQREVVAYVADGAELEAPRRLSLRHPRTGLTASEVTALAKNEQPSLRVSLASLSERMKSFSEKAFRLHSIDLPGFGSLRGPLY